MARQGEAGQRRRGVARHGLAGHGTARLKVAATVGTMAVAAMGLGGDGEQVAHFDGHTFGGEEVE